jgi:hypothetical protein
MKKEEVDKRVRSLTKLTKDHAVAELASNYFDSVHPLPEVCIYLFRILAIKISLVSNCVYPCIGYFSDLTICRTINSSFHFLLFLKKGLLRLIWPPLYLKPPRLKKIRTEMKPKTSPSTSPPPALSEDTGVYKKRKRVDEFASSSISAQRTTADEAPILEEDVEFFDLMAS